MRDPHLLFGDVETTGLGREDKIVELAWMATDFDLNILAEDSRTINPERPIPAGSSAIHGLRDADVAHAPNINSYFEELGGSFPGHPYFVAHNARFDYRFLKDYLPAHTPIFCTVQMARAVWPDVDNHKLGTLVYALDLQVDKGRFHSADGDMVILLELMKKAMEDTGKSIKELLELARLDMSITTLQFGKKHKGKRLEDVPADYFDWMLREVTNLDPDLEDAIRAELVRRAT